MQAFERKTKSTPAGAFVLVEHKMQNPNRLGSDLRALVEELGITVNSKGIPFDPSPVAMGVRMGTTVLSQRGMGDAEMEEIAEILYLAATHPEDGEMLGDLKGRVRSLAERFPIPAEYDVHG